MVNVEDIVDVPGWTIEKVVSNNKKIQLTVSLPLEIIGDRANNVVRGLTSLLIDEHPTSVGVYSPNEDDPTQAVLPDLSAAEASEDAEDEEESDSADSDDDNFIEVN